MSHARETRLPGQEPKVYRHIANTAIIPGTVHGFDPSKFQSKIHERVISGIINWLFNKLSGEKKSQNTVSDTSKPTVIIGPQPIESVDTTPASVLKLAPVVAKASLVAAL